MDVQILPRFLMTLDHVNVRSAPQKEEHTSQSQFMDLRLVFFLFTHFEEDPSNE
jgi:hypothetical protein